MFCAVTLQQKMVAVDRGLRDHGDNLRLSATDGKYFLGRSDVRSDTESILSKSPAGRASASCRGRSKSSFRSGVSKETEDGFPNLSPGDHVGY